MHLGKMPRDDLSDDRVAIWALFGGLMGLMGYGALIKCLINADYNFPAI